MLPACVTWTPSQLYTRRSVISWCDSVSQSADHQQVPFAAPSDEMRFELTQPYLRCSMRRVYLTSAWSMSRTSKHMLGSSGI